MDQEFSETILSKHRARGVDMSNKVSEALSAIIRAQENFNDEKALKTSSEEFRLRDSGLKRLEVVLSDLAAEHSISIGDETPQFSSGGGMGIASPVAWLRIFDSTAPKATRGWYLTLFFPPGGGGFYFSLSQGANYGGTKKEGSKLVAKIRRRDDLPKELMEPIELGKGSKAKAYRDVTPLARYFSLSQIEQTSDSQYAETFAELVSYLQIVKKDFPVSALASEGPRRSWLIQYSPDQWDFDQFLADGHRELAFKVGQHLDQISEGDPIFMWRSGRNGGFVARGRISQPPVDGGNHEVTIRYYKQAVDVEEVRTRVLIEIDEKFDDPISKEEFRDMSPDSLIFRSPQSASPFTLSAAEVKMIEARLKGEKPESAVSLGDLATELLLPESWLASVREILIKKKQVIFQGPPGTGKTFLAKAISRSITSPDRVSVVQFHPSYAYEDFVEGFRPSEANGTLIFEVKAGPLVQIAERAQADPENTYVLIIDEINRGNLAKVFGELYFLLEYRDEEISLQYGDTDRLFSLPSNLLLVGTMNTADRSVSSLDAAIRRRFAFIDLVPDKEPVEGLLRRWLEEKGKPVWVADFLDIVNLGINDSRFKLGPSYFMVQDIEDDLENVWNYQILPQLHDVHFGDPKVLNKYTFESIETQVDKI